MWIPLEWITLMSFLVRHSIQTFYQDPEEYGKIESNKYFIRICIEGIQYVSWYDGNSSWTPLVNKYGKPLRCKIIEKKTN